MAAIDPLRKWRCDGLPINASIQSVWSPNRSPSHPMAEDRVQRRLAAILAADVVGFSRLMGEDEAGTLAVLNARRKEVVEPVVARHRGRIFKVMGDGNSSFQYRGKAVDVRRVARELGVQYVVEKHSKAGRSNSLHGSVDRCRYRQSPVERTLRPRIPRHLRGSRRCHPQHSRRLDSWTGG